jgi:hypothetical protein
MWLTRHTNGIFNLQHISLIPLVAELGIESHQFDEELQ